MEHGISTVQLQFLVLISLIAQVIDPVKEHTP